MTDSVRPYHFQLPPGALTAIEGAAQALSAYTTAAAALHIQEAMGERLAEQVRAIVSPAVEAHASAVREAVADLMPDWGEMVGTTLAGAVTASTAAEATISRLLTPTAPGLQRVLEDLDSLQVFNAEMRAAAAAGLMEAHRQAEEAHGELDEELASSLEGAVEEFARTQSAGMSQEHQRSLFIWVVGIALMMLLVQSMVESEAMEELLSHGSAVWPIVAAVMLYGAGPAWDRWHGVRRSDPDED
ncbi:hypothetical protein [Streptomyces diastaticus]